MEKSQDDYSPRSDPKRNEKKVIGNSKCIYSQFQAFIRILQFENSDFFPVNSIRPNELQVDVRAST
jgi:hypothetical protein